MASPSASASAHLLFSVLFLLALGAAARPCKGLISYAVSYTSYGGASSGSASAFEVSQIAAAGEQFPARFFTIHRLLPLRYYSYASYSSSSGASFADPFITSLRHPVGVERGVHEESSFGVNSVRDRARDILIVVAGLLFGVGCGGLASVAMYLACSLINNGQEVPGSHGYVFVDDDEEDGVLESPKKMGYTGLPAVPATPVAPLKEGFGGP